MNLRAERKLLFALLVFSLSVAGPVGVQHAVAQIDLTLTFESDGSGAAQEFEFPTDFSAEDPNGGSATAMTDVQGQGEVLITAETRGGNGITGGVATIDGARAVSDPATEELTVRLTATGGNGSAGSGADATINNVLDGDTASQVLVVQTANGGRAGSGAQSVVAGNAFSGATATQATDGDLTVIAHANGGSGPDRDNGVGGVGEANVNITNLVGDASATADAEGGLAGRGGAAIGRAVATGGGSDTLASARAQVDGGDGRGAGGDATGFAEAFNTGSGQASSAVFAVGDSGRSGPGGDVEGQARSSVTGTGRAVATVSATAGSGADGGSVIANAFAESTLGDASAGVAISQGSGSDVPNFDLSAVNGGDGVSFNEGMTAAGSAGGLLALSFNATAGSGGSVDTLGDGNGGNGGSVTSQFQSSDLNPGGDDVRLLGSFNGGDGGGGRATGDGGVSADAIVNYDIADTGDVSSNFTVLTGTGGIASGAGDGGNSGNANLVLRATSTTNGVVNISSNVQSRPAGGAADGNAGDSGDAISNLTGVSHGGDVFVDSFVWASGGGRNFGTGLAGDGGEGRSTAVALTSQVAATAQSSAIGGAGGLGNTPGIGGDAFSSAFADNRFVGLANGEFARAEADARGAIGRAEATAVTGNSAFGRVQVNSVAEGAEVNTLSLARVGGVVFTEEDGNVDSDFPSFNAVGQMVVSPDNIPIFTEGSSPFGSPSLLAALGVNDHLDTDKVLAVGTFAGTSIEGTTATSAASFRIGIDANNADDLLIGFFGGGRNGFDFGRINLSVDIEGFDAFQVSLTNEADANNFFSDTVINLGDFADINSLAGVSVLEGNLTFDYFAGPREGGYLFNYAIVGAQTAELTSIPEPSTIPLVCGVVALLVGRRRTR